MTAFSGVKCTKGDHCLLSLLLHDAQQHKNVIRPAAETDRQHELELLYMPASETNLYNSKFSKEPLCTATFVELVDENDVLRK